MEAFNNNPSELATFISLTILAVVLLPIAFIKIGEWLQ